MRPAAPGEQPNDRLLAVDERPLSPPYDDGSFTFGTRRSRRPKRRRWLASRLTLAGLALLLLGASVPLAIIRRPTAGQAPRPTSPPSPPPLTDRPAFVFPLANVVASTTGRRGARATRAAAIDIQTTLSRFYDRVILDPAAWRGTIPPEAWEAFSPSLRDRAIKDADSFTISEIGRQVADLEAGPSSLRVRILVDPLGRPEAAIAYVGFLAAGSLVEGERIEVVGRASFILRPGRRGWLIVGYPTATTTVQTISPPSTRRLAAGTPSSSKPGPAS